jgi:LPS O-antigen subunit length determinant protein (WzzB/FepE family)
VPPHLESLKLSNHNRFFELYFKTNILNKFMTEKEIPLSSTPYQDQNFKHEPEDEINLLDLLGLLVRKKDLILSTASIFIVLSIFYAFSFTLIYRATIGLLPPEKSLISFFPNLIHSVLPNVSRNTKGTLVIKENYMLNKFISELQSYSNQEKVFMEGKFHERFVANNPKIDIKKGIVQEIYKSIHESGRNGETVQGALASKFIDYDMKGVNPELASDYLNALADWVKNKVELDIKESIQEGVKAQIAFLSVELDTMITLEKQKYKDEIRDLTDNIEIAKNLGILDHNFDNFKPESSSFSEEKVNTDATGLFITSRHLVKRIANSTWPTWYLYGQIALEHEMNLLERRGFSSKYTKETEELTLKIEQLSSIDWSKIIFDPVIISVPSITPVDPINMKKMQVVAIGIVIGLFFGILMALLSSLMTRLRERLKLSP